MVTNTLLRIEFIKVVGTEILIGLVVAEYEIDGNEQAVLNNADGPLFPRRPARRWYCGILGASAFRRSF
jgi:hypothetical protein